MLMSEWHAALDRAKVYDLAFQTHDMYAVAEHLYGSGDGLGGELVPGGQAGHDAVAKMVKKNPALFLALQRLHENLVAGRKNDEMAIQAQRTAIQHLEKQVEQQAKGLDATAAVGVRLSEDLLALRLAATEEKYKLHEAQDKLARAEIVIDIFTKLYGQQALDVVNLAVTGKNLNRLLDGRCENDRPTVEELQAIH